MNAETVKTVCTYVVAFLSSGVGATLIGVLAKSIISAVSTNKLKKHSKLDDIDKNAIAQKVTDSVLKAIQNGVDINAEAMIDKATNRRIDVMESKTNEMIEIVKKVYELAKAEGVVLCDLKTPSLSSRQALQALAGDTVPSVETIPVVEQSKLSVDLQETEQRTQSLHY